MTGFEDMSVEELESKLEDYEQWDWSTNKAAVEKELEKRGDDQGEVEELENSPMENLPVEEMSVAELSDYDAEKKAEIMYQYVQVASKYGDAGQLDTYHSMLDDVDELTEHMSGEVNQRYQKKVNSQWE